MCELEKVITERLNELDTASQKLDHLETMEMVLSATGNLNSHINDIMDREWDKANSSIEEHGVHS